jgi:hypothetical protein
LLKSDLDICKSVGKLQTKLAVKVSFICMCRNFVLFYVVEITNTMHCFVPLLYSTYWLLHVSAVVCHQQGASWIRLLLEIQIDRSVFQATQTDPRRSLVMADHCRNM